MLCIKCLCVDAKKKIPQAPPEELPLCVCLIQEHVIIIQEHNKKIVYGLTGIMCTGRREREALLQTRNRDTHKVNEPWHRRERRE